MLGTRERGVVIAAFWCIRLPWEKSFVGALVTTRAGSVTDTRAKSQDQTSLNDFKFAEGVNKFSSSQFAAL